MAKAKENTMKPSPLPWKPGDSEPMPLKQAMAGGLSGDYLGAAWLTLCCEVDRQQKVNAALVEAAAEVLKYWEVCNVKVPAGLKDQLRAALALAEKPGAAVKEG